jgi:hypothetical protein
MTMTMTHLLDLPRGDRGLAMGHLYEMLALCETLGGKIGKAEPTFRDKVLALQGEYFSLDLPEDACMQDALKGLSAKRIRELHDRLEKLIKQTAKENGFQMIERHHRNSPNYYFRKK